MQASGGGLPGLGAPGPERRHGLLGDTGQGGDLPHDQERRPGPPGGVQAVGQAGQTLKTKRDVDIRPYLILGACNPRMAHEALQIEDKVGTMLPCNVVVQELAPGRVEVAAIDPVASMRAVDNPRLLTVAAGVGDMLRRMVQGL